MKGVPFSEALAHIWGIRRLIQFWVLPQFEYVRAAASVTVVKSQIGMLN